MKKLEINDPDYYMSEPKRQISCSVATDAEYRSLTAALGAADVDMKAVRVIQGTEGAEIMDMTGERHGLVANVKRFFPSINTTIREHMAAVEDVLVAGGYAILIPARQQQDADALASILSEQGAGNIFWWGKNTMIWYNRAATPAS